MADNTPVTVHRGERVLAYMVASSIGLAVLSIFAILIGSFAKLDLTLGLWPVIRILPLIGLPIGFLMLIALIIISGLRRGREAKDARN